MASHLETVRRRCEAERELPVGVLEQVADLQPERGLSRPERRHRVLPARDDVEKGAPRRGVALVQRRIVARTHEKHRERRGGDERRIMHDYVNWRREARTVTDLGAWRTLQRNLVVGGRQIEPVTAAELTASALALARVPPLLGRPLVEADRYTRVWVGARN